MLGKILIFLSAVCLTRSARILGFFPIPSVSHQLVFQPIYKELALRGHEVTVISPISLRENIANLTEINIWSSGFKKLVPGSTVQKCLGDYALQRHFNLADAFLKVFPLEFDEAAFMNFVNSTEQFDLVIVENMHPAAYGMASKFNAPFIGISSMDIFLNSHDAVGNPTHPIISPDIFHDNYENLSFFERLNSVLFNVAYRIMYHYYLLPEADKFARKYFGEDMPYLGDIEKNVSLLLVNRHPILGGIRSSNPAIVDMTGLHIKPKKPLPEDLKELLDEATEGVVYFSMGSNVKSANFSDEARKTVCDALGSLPYKVIWKYEIDYLPGKPDNVILKKWLPQQDLLGHPNVKVFVTQGGIQSIEEAVDNQVPMVTIPYFLDQFRNCKRAKDLGISRYIDFKTLNHNELRDAIIDVAENPKYKENIVNARKLLNDEPMTGLEKSIWWIEYVIRHNGAKHLRSPGADMPFYQYFLIDVAAFLLAVVVASFYISFKMYKLLTSTVKKVKKD